MSGRGRRMAWHGVLLFLLSMLEGMVVQSLANPRLALSAHVGGAMSGMFLLLLGLAWSSLRLGPRAESWAYGSALLGFYGSTVGLVLAAAVGTRNSTPLNGAPVAASPLWEGLVNLLLSAGGVAVLVACALALWGLRGGAAGEG